MAIGGKSALMDIIHKPDVAATFLNPAMAATPGARHYRHCPSLPDDEWVRNSVMRCLHQESSGRGYVQRLADREDRLIPLSTYFSAHATTRRLNLLREVTETVGRMWDVQARAAGRDPLSAFPCLDGYDLYAGDGHYLAASTHDPAINGTRYAIGHFFGLNLRTHRLFHMTVGERGDGRKREHDMRALKRLETAALRRDAPVGRRVIWVWDRAGIDAAWWQQQKQQHGIYFISRTKENMKLETAGVLPFDKDDPINRGVLSFTLVIVNHQALRCVLYRDPVSQETFTFITSLTTVPPGVIAALYKARWDIEKVFDETKRKLGEMKSWGASDAARQIQAQAIALTHTLMLMLELRMEHEHGLQATDDADRRQRRFQVAATVARHRGGVSPMVEACWLRATQRGLRFIRWLRSMVDRKASLELAAAKLRAAWKVKLC